MRTVQFLHGMTVSVNPLFTKCDYLQKIQYNSSRNAVIFLNVTGTSSAGSRPRTPRSPVPPPYEPAGHDCVGRQSVFSSWTCWCSIFRHDRLSGARSGVDVLRHRRVYYCCKRAYEWNTANSAPADRFLLSECCYRSLKGAVAVAQTALRARRGSENASSGASGWKGVFAMTAEFIEAQESRGIETGSRLRAWWLARFRGYEVRGIRIEPRPTLLGTVHPVQRWVLTRCATVED